MNGERGEGDRNESNASRAASGMLLAAPFAALSLGFWSVVDFVRVDGLADVADFCSFATAFCAMFLVCMAVTTLIHDA